MSIGDQVHITFRSGAVLTGDLCAAYENAIAVRDSEGQSHVVFSGDVVTLSAPLLSALTEPEDRVALAAPLSPVVEQELNRILALPAGKPWGDTPPRPEPVGDSWDRLRNLAGLRIAETNWQLALKCLESIPESARNAEDWLTAARTSAMANTSPSIAARHLRMHWKTLSGQVEPAATEEWNWLLQETVARGDIGLHALKTAVPAERAIGPNAMRDLLAGIAACARHLGAMEESSRYGSLDFTDEARVRSAFDQLKSEARTLGAGSRSTLALEHTGRTIRNRIKVFNVDQGWGFIVDGVAGCYFRIKDVVDPDLQEALMAGVDPATQIWVEGDVIRRDGKTSAVGLTRASSIETAGDVPRKHTAQDPDLKDSELPSEVSLRAVARTLANEGHYAKAAQSLRRHIDRSDVSDGLREDWSNYSAWSQKPGVPRGDSLNARAKRFEIVEENFTEAIETWKAAYATGPASERPAAALELARMYLRRNIDLPGEAVAVIDDGLKKKIFRPVTRARRVLVEALMRSGHFDRVNEEARRLLQSPHLSGPDRAFIVSQQATALMELGETKPAIEALSKYLETVPEAPAAISRLLASAYIRAGDIETAEGTLKEHLNRFPTDSLAQEMLDSYEAGFSGPSQMQERNDETTDENLDSLVRALAGRDIVGPYAMADFLLRHAIEWGNRPTGSKDAGLVVRALAQEALDQCLRSTSFEAREKDLIQRALSTVLTSIPGIMLGDRDPVEVLKNPSRSEDSIVKSLWVQLVVPGHALAEYLEYDFSPDTQGEIAEARRERALIERALQQLIETGRTDQPLVMRTRCNASSLDAKRLSVIQDAAELVRKLDLLDARDWPLQDLQDCADELEELRQKVQDAPASMAPQILAGQARLAAELERFRQRVEQRSVSDLQVALAEHERTLHVGSWPSKVPLSLVVDNPPSNGSVYNLVVKAEVLLTTEAGETLVLHKSELPKSLKIAAGRRAFIHVPFEMNAPDQEAPLGAITTYQLQANFAVEHTWGLGKAKAGETRFSGRFVVTNSDLSTTNPYGPGNVVSDHRMFYGRSGLVNQLFEQFHNSSRGGVGIALWGQIRCGKSSVDLHLRRKLRDADGETTFVPAVVDSLAGELSADASPMSNMVTACATMYQALRDQAAHLHGVEAPEWDELKTKGHKRRLETGLERLRQQTELATGKSAQLILTLDEFTAVADMVARGLLPSSFFGMFKALLQAELLSLILIAHDGFEKLCRSNMNEFGVFQMRQLTYLDRPAAFSLISQPMTSAFGMPDGHSVVDESAAQEIFELSGGSAYLIQWLCNELVHNARERGRPFVTHEHVLRVAQGFIENPPANLFGGIRNDLDTESIAPPDMVDFVARCIVRRSRGRWARSTDVISDLGESGVADPASVIRHLVSRNVLRERDDQGEVQIVVGLYHEHISFTIDGQKSALSPGAEDEDFLLRLAHR